MRTLLAVVVGVGLGCLPARVVAEDKGADEPSPELAAMIKDLHSKESKVRIKAAEDIGKLGEEAAPAARALCDAVMDASAKVATAALDAIEKVRPDLYKPLSTLILDSTPPKQLAAIKELGLMGDKASPAVNILLARLRRELANRANVGFSRGLSNMELAYFSAIRQIKPDDAETIKLFKVMAGTSNRDAYARLESIAFLNEWAGEDETKRKEVLPFLKAGLEEPTCCLMCIRDIGAYGVLAKDVVPQLKKLKLSSVEAVRDAASGAIDKIENP